LLRHPSPLIESPEEEYNGNESVTTQKQAVATPALDVGSQYVSWRKQALNPFRL